MGPGRQEGLAFEERYLTVWLLLKSRGKEWFERSFLPKFHPVMLPVCKVCNRSRAW